MMEKKQLTEPFFPFGLRMQFGCQFGEEFRNFLLFARRKRRHQIQFQQSRFQFLNGCHRTNERLLKLRNGECEPVKWTLDYLWRTNALIC